MENQHRKIKGYRELNEREIGLINKVKSLGQIIEDTVKILNDTPDIDKRWVAIGKTDLQTGLMALTRSVAKPDFF